MFLQGHGEDLWKKRKLGDTIICWPRNWSFTQDCSNQTDLEFWYLTSKISISECERPFTCSKSGWKEDRRWRRRKWMKCTCGQKNYIKSLREACINIYQTIQHLKALYSAKWQKSECFIYNVWTCSETAANSPCGQWLCYCIAAYSPKPLPRAHLLGIGKGRGHVTLAIFHAPPGAFDTVSSYLAECGRMRSRVSGRLSVAPVRGMPVLSRPRPARVDSERSWLRDHAKVRLAQPRKVPIVAPGASENLKKKIKHWNTTGQEEICGDVILQYREACS